MKLTSVLLSNPGIEAKHTPASWWWWGNSRNFFLHSINATMLLHKVINKVHRFFVCPFLYANCFKETFHVWVKIIHLQTRKKQYNIIMYGDTTDKTVFVSMKLVYHHMNKCQKIQVQFFTGRAMHDTSITAWSL